MGKRGLFIPKNGCGCRKVIPGRCFIENEETKDSLCRGGVLRASKDYFDQCQRTKNFSTGGKDGYLVNFPVLFPFQIINPGF